jgi:hypothetical protein
MDKENSKRNADMIDMQSIIKSIKSLRRRRRVFHSEADFQFALAWEIKRNRRDAEIRLEYPSTSEHIDILVRLGDGSTYPIELKYKTKSMQAEWDNEQFNLKNHGAQPLGAYDFINDICRIESFSKKLDGFKCGYAIWLTNDPWYWTNHDPIPTTYAAFSVHDTAIITGRMAWGDYSESTIKGREEPLSLCGRYRIRWNKYSNLDAKNGVFKYALISVDSVKMLIAKRRNLAEGCPCLR